jgi:hypothetical protein
MARRDVPAAAFPAYSEAQDPVLERPFPSDVQPALAASDAWAGAHPEAIQDVLPAGHSAHPDGAGILADHEQANLRPDAGQALPFAALAELAMMEEQQAELALVAPCKPDEAQSAA